MLGVLATTLVLVSAGMLCGSLYLTRRLTAQLPQGPLRNYWSVMLVFVCMFIVGYLGYAWSSRHSHTKPTDLIVPGVFFLGACFVWLTSNLSLRTAVSLMRISFLEEENISDPLTHAFNRRYLDRRLSEECANARRTGLPLSVLMLDIDHFKRVNDSFGHQAGDLVLAAFTALVKQQLRSQDILTRFGGEEFVVIATHTPLPGAVELAERLRSAIQSNRFILMDGPGHAPGIGLTCSFGVASLGEEADQASELLGLADTHLYRAKHEGRNRVCAGPSAPLASPEPGTQAEAPAKTLAGGGSGIQVLT